MALEQQEGAGQLGGDPSSSDPDCPAHLALGVRTRLARAHTFSVGIISPQRVPEGWYGTYLPTEIAPVFLRQYPVSAIVEDEP